MTKEELRAVFEREFPPVPGLIWLDGRYIAAEVEEDKSREIQEAMLTAFQRAYELFGSEYRGHHDCMPTRRGYSPDSDAGKCDAWWQDYYLSNDKENKRIAKKAIDAAIKKEG